MLEKILTKLKLQRGQTSNVSDRTLADLAKSLETIITTDALLEAMDLTASIESFNGNINHYTADAFKKDAEAKEAKKIAEQKALDEKKAADLLAAATNQQAQGTTTSDPNAELIKTLLEQNKQIMSTLTGLQGEKVTSTRVTQLDAALKGLPDYIAKPIKSTFKDNFENDEAFSAYLTTVSDSRKQFEQAANEQGLNTSTPPPAKPAVKDELTGIFAEAFAAHDEQNKENK